MSETAEQCREMGLVVGDVIQGRETFGDEWSESRLTLLFAGQSVAVFKEQTRNDEQTEWMYRGESASWTLSFRPWHKL